MKLPSTAQARCSDCTPIGRHRLLSRRRMRSTITLTSQASSAGSPSRISASRRMPMRSSPPSTDSTFRAASSALSTKRCSRPERRKELSGRRQFAACVLCSWRRNSKQCSSSLTTTSVLSSLSRSRRSAPSRRPTSTRANSTRRPRCLRYRLPSRSTSHHLPSPRCLLVPASSRHRTSSISTILRRSKSIRAFYSSRMTRCATNSRSPERCRQNRGVSCTLWPRSLAFTITPSARAKSGMLL